MTTQKQRRAANRAPSSQLALNLEVFAIETPSGMVAAAGENPIDAAIRRTLVDAMEKAIRGGLAKSDSQLSGKAGA